MSIADLPDGATYVDQRWQIGFYDGFSTFKPSSTDPIYVAGWCMGYMGIETSRDEAVAAYERMK